MADITPEIAAPRPANPATRKVRESLARRRRKQLVLQGLGLGAICIAFLMLFILIASLVSTGYKAFVQTHVTLEVFVDPEEIDPERLPRGDFDDVLAASLLEYLPGVDAADRAAVRQAIRWSLVTVSAIRPPCRCACW